jgi:3-deoxy-D-manno-octulosonic-acid transferase
MSKSFSLLLYNLLLPVGLAVMLPGALRKMRARGGHWSDLAQRFGFLPKLKHQELARLPVGRDRLWLHAVSVGEVGIATKLMARMLTDLPQLGFVVTTSTPTGYAMAEEFAVKQSGRVVVLYSPVDLPWVGARFLAQLQPAQIVLIEAELWPNLVAAAKRDGISVSMVNARLSGRSERRFQKFGFFIRPVFAMLDQVLVQEPGDTSRFAGLGVDPSRIHHTGSIKFDPQGAAVDEAQLVQLRQILRQAGITEKQPILLLASTHPGEEVLLARVALSLRATYPDLALLIVPRHVERTPAIIEELQPLGIQPQRRSQLTAAGPSALHTLIIDTTGELRAWQCLATLVVVGKSFLADGGQNPAEAVMAQKPVLFGPHMENFEALVELLLKDQGAIQVADVQSLEIELSRLLADPALRDQLGRSGQAVLSAHEGATVKTICRLFPKKEQ